MVWTAIRTTGTMSWCRDRQNGHRVLPLMASVENIIRQFPKNPSRTGVCGGSPERLVRAGNRGDCRNIRVPHVRHCFGTDSAAAMWNPSHVFLVSKTAATSGVSVSLATPSVSSCWACRRPGSPCMPASPAGAISDVRNCSWHSTRGLFHRVSPVSATARAASFAVPAIVSGSPGAFTLDNGDQAQ
jgi:hypothetical protein